MNFKTQISKAVTLIVIALLFFSFKVSYWEIDKKTSATIYKSIAKVFNSKTCNINAFDEIFCVCSVVNGKVRRVV